MLGAYSMFPDGGINTQPYYITKIEDKNGIVLKTFAPIQKEIINSSTAFKMVKLMRGVVDMGTGHRLRFRYGFTNDIAGKTGTTSNQADAWFIGYTPQIIAGAWVGHDDRVFRFGSEDLGQGAAAALPIWAFFMKRVYADKNLRINNDRIDKDAKFKQPDNFDDCDASDPVSEARKSTYGSSRNDQEPVEHGATEEWGK
jgi:penicillin-binding protein 1A